MKAEKPNLPLLMLSMHDESLYAALRALAPARCLRDEKAEALTHAWSRRAYEVRKNEIYVSPEFSQRLVFPGLSNPSKAACGSARRPAFGPLSSRSANMLRTASGPRGSRPSFISARRPSRPTWAHIKEKLGSGTPRWSGSPSTGSRKKRPISGSTAGSVHFCRSRGITSARLPTKRSRRASEGVATIAVNAAHPNPAKGRFSHRY